jgi:hypothetical protein
MHRFDLHQVCKYSAKYRIVVYEVCKTGINFFANVCIDPEKKFAKYRIGLRKVCRNYYFISPRPPQGAQQ